MKQIYMDNAATTKVAPEVFDAMLPFFCEQYGNPSSAYRFSGQIADKVAEARKTIADAIGASDREIFFTSGGSESDNWAIKGISDALSSKGNHIITSKIEHHAVLHTCEFLEKHGFEVTYLPVDEKGRISLEELEKAIRPTTILISIMFANNEIGTIEPVAEIGKIAHEHGVVFHTDAVQAFGHVPISVNELNIDLMSISAHKIHGPKGTGFLYARRGVPLLPLINGGAQEKGKRAGTENLPGIVGMAAALKETVAERDTEAARLTALRDRLIAGLGEIPHSALNGDAEKRLPGNVSFCFEGIEGESLLLLLDEKGISASSGSACTSGSLDPSHVLLAIGRVHDVAHGSLRLTLGRENTPEDVEYIISAVKDVVAYLRSFSPVWRDLQSGKTPHIL